MLKLFDTNEITALTTHFLIWNRENNLDEIFEEKYISITSGWVLNHSKYPVLVCIIINIAASLLILSENEPFGKI